MKNIKKYQKKLFRIINFIRNELDENIVSIFGAGHWFLDEEARFSDIDIIIVVDDKIIPSLEFKLKVALKECEFNNINGFPVSLTLFWEKELEGTTVGKCRVASNKKLLKVYIRQFYFYLLLYGKKWNDYNSSLLPLSFEEELEYNIELIKNPPSKTFLIKEDKENEEFFSWQDLIKTFFYARILGACIDEKYIYDTSFFKLRAFLSSVSNDLIHKAFEYRYYDFDVKLKDKRSFYNEITMKFN